MPDSCFIQGFALSRFRSFSDDFSAFGPFKKINVLIGANNSGKSNVLRFIRRYYNKIISGEDFEVDFGDRPRNKPDVRDWYSILYCFDPDELSSENGTILRDLLKLHPLHADDGYYWLNIGGGSLAEQGYFPTTTNQPEIPIGTLYEEFNGETFGGLGEEASLDDILRLLRGKLTLPQKDIVFIPAYRRLQSNLPEYFDDYGKHDKESESSMIQRLAMISQPTYLKPETKKDFEKLVSFLRDVLNEPKLEIYIPHDRKTINVHLHGKHLPMEALGTGIHELIMLSAETILSSERIICIEEPELHLHPDLQRQFMRFIDSYTDNQYFITTHSAHIMDAVPCSIHRLFLEGGVSKVSRPITSDERREVCHELGYKPSDLLQSNCVIWVEGPSDRIYVQHWLKHEAADLKEGIHFSIMFYGGSLRSHLSADDTVVSKFISLLAINRFTAMIIDSDRSGLDDHLNASKNRIEKELEKTGFCWITSGREIENYVPSEILTDAVKSVYPKMRSLASEERIFGKPLDYISDPDGVKVERGFDKVAIANAVCQRAPNTQILDLRVRLSELVSFIKRANGAVEILQR